MNDMETTETSVRDREPCTRTLRSRSLPGIGAALALILFFAWWAAFDSESEAEGLATNNAGDPSSSGASGDGPGADSKGDGTSAASQTDDEDPRGDAGTPLAQIDPRASGNEAPETRPALPRIGFTPPEDPPVAAPRVSPVVVAPGGSGAGGSAGRSGGSGTSFMGIETSATKIVYILDFSGSMFGSMSNPKIDHMILELKKSVNRLPDDHSFYVIFFDDAPLPMGGDAMVLATRANKNKWFAWADVESVGVHSRGGTDPSEALAFALSQLKPDAIYLLTDGGFDGAATFAAITTHNATHRVQINTIGFHDRTNEPMMQTIARENHGEYRYIPPPATP